MNPMLGFEKAITKAEHSLYLYDLLKNTRARKVRSSWVTKFKKFMVWNKSTPIMRVDGEDSILIIRNPKAGLTYEKFEHDYLSELLRSALVAAVSAMDKYFHDHSVAQCYKLLSGAEKDIPNKLLQLELPATETFKALKKVRADATARPGSQLKMALQSKLHKSTFQGCSGIDECMSLMGIKKFWGRSADKLPDGMDALTLKKAVNKIVRRRNFIVHEADIERKVSASKITFNKIDRKLAHDAISQIKDFVRAAEQVLSE